MFKTSGKMGIIVFLGKITYLARTKDIGLEIGFEGGSVVTEYYTSNKARELEYIELAKSESQKKKK